jgi:hypothetical protein
MLKAAATYFALVFAAGFVLGPIRELWLVPYWGSTAGILIEAPFMVAAMILAVRRVLRRFAVPAGTVPRLVVGLLAFGLLMIAELAGALVLRGWSLEHYLASLGTLPGLISLLLFLLFAAMPALVGLGRRLG